MFNYKKNFYLAEPTILLSLFFFHFFSPPFTSFFPLLFSTFLSSSNFFLPFFPAFLPFFYSSFYSSFSSFLYFFLYLFSFSFLLPISAAFLFSLSSLHFNLLDYSYFSFSHFFSFLLFNHLFPSYFTSSPREKIKAQQSYNIMISSLYILLALSPAPSTTIPSKNSGENTAHDSSSTYSITVSAFMCKIALKDVLKIGFLQIIVLYAHAQNVLEAMKKFERDQLCLLGTIFEHFSTLKYFS